MEHTVGPQHIQTGKRGEDLAEKYLKNKGFLTIKRNYRKKWGEIDLIMRKGQRIHFVEVKTVSYETVQALKLAVSYGTYRPEENVHDRKLQRLGRAIQTWRSEKREAGAFQLDVLTVRMVPREKYAVVDVIEGVVLN